MARRHFEHFEALSMALPAGDAFEAVIATKRRDSDEPPRIHKVAYGQHYDLASEAEVAAEAALTKVAEISQQGELLWEASSRPSGQAQ